VVKLESIDMFLELLYANNLPFGMEKIGSVGGFLKMEGSRFVLLRKRGKIVVDRCCICKNCGEMVDHPLLHCNLVKELWPLALNLFGMHSLMPHAMIDVFENVGEEIYSS
jgi:hypothetical protein